MVRSHLCTTAARTWDHQGIREKEMCHLTAMAFEGITMAMRRTLVSTTHRTHMPCNPGCNLHMQDSRPLHIINTRTTMLTCSLT